MFFPFFCGLTTIFINARNKKSNTPEELYVHCLLLLPSIACCKKDDQIVSFKIKEILCKC